MFVKREFWTVFFCLLTVTWIHSVISIQQILCACCEPGTGQGAVGL